MLKEIQISLFQQRKKWIKNTETCQMEKRARLSVDADCFMFPIPPTYFDSFSEEREYHHNRRQITGLLSKTTTSQSYALEIQI